MTRACRVVLVSMCVSGTLLLTMSSSRAVEDSSRYLFVWAGDMDRQDSEFLTVLDLQPAAVGTVAWSRPCRWARRVSSLTTRSTSSVRPACSSPTGSPAIARSCSISRIPSSRRLIHRFSSANDLSFMHSLVRLPNGHVLATMQGHGPDNRVPGGLAEIDDTGSHPADRERRGPGGAAPGHPAPVQPDRRAVARSRRRRPHADGHTRVVAHARSLRAPGPRRRSDSGLAAVRPQGDEDDHVAGDDGRDAAARARRTAGARRRPDRAGGDHGVWTVSTHGPGRRRTRRPSSSTTRRTRGAPCPSWWGTTG